MALPILIIGNNKPILLLMKRDLQFAKVCSHVYESIAMQINIVVRSFD